MGRALEVRPVARGACDRLSLPTFHHQRLAFRQAADRHIGGEGRPRIAALELLQIVGNFDDPVPDRLAFAALHRRPEESCYVRFWHSVAFDHLDALARSQGREIGRSRFHLGIGDRLGKSDHHARRHATRHCGAPCATLIVSHLPDDVVFRKAREVGVLRAPGPSAR
jgi:hypothetical protein